MIKRISILNFQLLIIILETTSNLLEPKRATKVLNTEKTVLSMGDIDNDDDLEIIKGSSKDNQMQEKFNNLHKFVNIIEMTNRPKEKFFMTPYDKRKSVPLFEMSYPDSPDAIALNEKHLSELERRSKLEKKKEMKKKRKGKKILRRGEYSKIIQQKEKIIPKSMPNEYFNDRDLDKEYLEDLFQNMYDNKAFKYSDEGKPEESLRDVLHKITDIKTPKDCINYTGLGVQEVECIWKNFKTGVINREQFFYSISLIVLIWFLLYLIITVPFWCAKGWCCCCCRFSFCFPNKTVADIKKCIELNPPGVHTDAQGVRKEYVPTPKETELYERLRRLIADF